jgi:hypothetical protein
MLEVGRTYHRIFSSSMGEETVTIREMINRRAPPGSYFLGSDWNHYDSMGRRGAYGIIDYDDIYCRKFDLCLVPNEMRLKEMLEECLN